MILRLSEKLSRKIRVTPTALHPLNDNPYADFSCHCFMVDTQVYFLAANTASLYAVVFPGNAIDRSVEFEAALYHRLKGCVLQDGFEFLYKRLIERDEESVSYSRPLNAAITASVNQLASKATTQLRKKPESTEAVTGAINGSPLPLIRYERPIDRFRTLSIHH